VNQYPYDFSYVDTKVAERVSLLAKSVETDYDPNGNSLTTTKTYQYNTVNLLPAKITTSTSTGDSLVTIYSYPQDVNNSALVSHHMLTPVIEADNYKNNTFLNSVRAEYNSTIIMAPSDIITTQGNNPAEKRVVFSYDNYNNLIDAAKYNDRVDEIYAYGYNSSLPVAKIEHSNVSGASVIQAIAGLNQTTLNNPPSDDALRTELNKLRTQFP